MKLKGKVAIVTGAASGIGRAVAETFAREGAKMIVADINDERGADTVSAIKKAGGKAEYVHTDVRKQKANDAMFDAAIKKYGGLDILVCNAGIMDGYELVGNVSDETWERVFAINTFGPMMQIRRAVRHLESNSIPGTIIVVASVAGLGGGRAGVSYTAAKRATVALAQNTAFGYAKKGIRVNVIAPGGVSTNISESMKNLDEEGNKVFNAGAALMPRLGQPQELADVALFLASDESHFVNGAVIPVDGGWNAY